MWKVREFVSEQAAGGGLDGEVGAVLLHRERVVDAITEERDATPLGLELFQDL